MCTPPGKVPVLTDGNKDLIQTGVKYRRRPRHFARKFRQLDRRRQGRGRKYSATLMPGSVGLYQVLLREINIPTDSLTQLTIAQDIYVSNIVTLPVAAAGGSAAPLADASNAIVSAANPSGGNAVAPGSIVSCSEPTSRPRPRSRTLRTPCPSHSAA